LFHEDENKEDIQENGERKQKRHGAISDARNRGKLKITLLSISFTGIAATNNHALESPTRRVSEMEDAGTAVPRQKTNVQHNNTVREDRSESEVRRRTAREAGDAQPKPIIKQQEINVGRKRSAEGTVSLAPPFFSGKERWKTY